MENLRLDVSERSNLEAEWCPLPIEAHNLESVGNSRPKEDKNYNIRTIYFGATLCNISLVRLHRST